MWGDTVKLMKGINRPEFMYAFAAKVARVAVLNGMNWSPDTVTDAWHGINQPLQDGKKAMSS